MTGLVGIYRKILGFITFQWVKKARRQQAMGMAAGCLWSACVIYGLFLPENEDWACRGPMTPGHQELSCKSCHQPAEGSFRQQLQAKAAFMLGRRASDVPVGLMAVDTRKCLDCHAMPDDPHSVFRFREPRFAETRETLDVTQCGTCHQEHKGKVVTLANAAFCISCHQDLKIRKDPLEISHQQLIQQALWTTCMQCHDYHGNHQMVLPNTLQDTIPVQKILQYFDEGADPYSSEKKVRAKTNVEEQK